MRIVNLIQGSKEWHAHRAAHWNASDAPAMLGASSNKKRSELLREVSTGVEREFSDYVQEKIIAPGHTFEALAREFADSILGEELYPCVAVAGKLSASLDGLTVSGEIAWEHKRMNKGLRDVMHENCIGAELPEMYRIQCEHQLIVSNAERVLFMASDWTDDGVMIEERHCWYWPDADLRARIVVGWEQFAVDLQDYQPREHAPAPIGRAPGQLMPLVFEATGVVTHSNAEAWESWVSVYLGNINRELVTDQDFANADAAVKWCSSVEADLEAAKTRILNGSESVASLHRLLERVQEDVRQTRLPLSKLVEARKMSRRMEIVERGKHAVIAHYSTINASLGAHAIAHPPALVAELGLAIKGTKSFSSMDDAVDSAVANLKIAASQQADRVRANITALSETEGEYASLFPDRVQLCAGKATDDLRNLAAARIAEHKAKEERRMDAERERIRAEELARIRREDDERARLADIEKARLFAICRGCGNRSDDCTCALPGPFTGPLTGGADTCRAGPFTDLCTAGLAPPLCLARDGEPPSFLAGHPAAFRVPRDKLDPAYGDVYVSDPYYRDATIEERLAVAAAAPLANDGATIKLGDINARIVPLTISADGMSRLGFDPISTQGAAKLYRASDFERMIDAMVAQLRCGDRMVR